VPDTDKLTLGAISFLSVLAVACSSNSESGASPSTIGGSHSGGSNSGTESSSSTNSLGSGGTGPATGGVGALGGTGTVTGGMGALGGSGTTAPAGGTRSSTAGAMSTGGSRATTGGVSSTSSKATGGQTTSSTTAVQFTIDASLSTAIPTVGIVTWSVTAPVTSAHIEFGRTQNAFEYSAPVDLTKQNYRTLLLGMKQDTTYYFRIVAQNGGSTYSSDVKSIVTGYLPNGLPVMDVTDKNASGLFAEGGFTVNCTGLAGATGIPGAPGGKTYAYIFDKDGDQVWAFDFSNTSAKGCSRARMSFDGEYMWAGNFANVSTTGAVTRVTMDGLSTPQNFSLPGRSHDFAILPNGHILYFSQNNGGGYTNGKEGPDSIKELNPDTSETTLIYNEETDFSTQINDSQGAHTNQVNYVPELDAVSFSMRHTSTIGLVSYPQGQLMAVFGGPISTFDISWDYQHGHELHDGKIWIFNNNGSNAGASILGYEYDISAKTATRFLDYSAGIASAAFGDVKLLPNGNLYVTYSTSGVFHEITSTGTLLREVKTSGAVGYSEHRGTLYGKPPPYDK